MATFDFSLLNQGHVVHNRDWNFGPICSSFSRIYWIDKGYAHMTFGGRKHKLTEGHLYLIPALTTHYDHCDSEFHQYYIHFMDRTKHIIDYYHRYDMPFELEATSEDKQLVLRLLRLCPNIRLLNPLPATYDTSIGTLDAAKRYQTLPLPLRMEINGIILQLLSRFFAKATPRQTVSDDRIVHTLYTIEQNLAEIPDIEHLANDVNLGKDRFIRLFRQQTGYTPTDYIIRHRIQQAQMLFIDGQRSVKDVALSLGYDNISYFGRLFKKVTDVTPSEFIRQNR